jgi:DNA repair protein RadC
MVIKDDLFDTFTPEKPTLIKEKKSKKDTGTLTNIIPQVELVRMGVQTLENIGDRKITDSQSATKILYKVFPKNQIGVQEFYYALYTDRANNVIAYYNLSKGGVSGTIADAELVGSVGIKLLAQGVLVAHNHPSGNLKPSEADIKMALHTKQVLKGLGITLLDSIIIVPGGEPVDKFEGYKYTSLQDEGKI